MPASLLPNAPRTPDLSLPVISRVAYPSDLSRTPPLTATGWFIALLFALALIGLIHDRDYATNSGAGLVEDGRGIDAKTVMEGEFDSSQATRGLGLLCLLTAAALCAATMPADARFRCDGFLALILLGLMWTTAGILWSPDHAMTAREIARLLVYAAVAALMARRFDPRQLCQVLAIMLGGSVLTALLYEIMTGGFQPWRADYRLTGSMHSNIFAAQATVVAVIAYAFAINRQPRARLWWAIFLIATLLVYLTKARTSLISEFVGVALIHILSRPARNWLLLLSATLTLAAILLLAAIMLGLLTGREAEMASTMGRSDDVSALTGRVPLWNFIWQQLPGYKLQGFGWGTFWVVDRTLQASDALGWFPRHSHNAYLQLIVNIGIIGLALALCVGIWGLVRAIRLCHQANLTQFAALAGIFASIFVSGVAESAFVMPRDMGLISAAICFALAVVHQHATIPAESRAVVDRSASFRPAVAR